MVDVIFNSKSFQMHQLFESDGYSTFCQHVYPSILKNDSGVLHHAAELADIVAYPQAVSRSFLPAHITTSAVVLSPNRDSCLLLMHKKIGEWVYPGGHADGDWHLLRSAVRECFEETGLDEVIVLSTKSGRGPRDWRDVLCPQSVQRFVIKSYGGVPEHLHYDFVYLLGARSDLVAHNENESSAIRWFSESILRKVAAGREGECVDDLDPLTARICINAMQNARNL